jgi:catechol 1,2-dioxygenase
VSAPGFRTLTTQIFDREDRWLHNDSVFAVNEDLIRRFEPRTDDPKARWTLQFDFVLLECN